MSDFDAAMVKAESEIAALKAERDALRAALQKVLDTGEAEARYAIDLQDDSVTRQEQRRYCDSMVAASNAEHEARELLKRYAP